MRTCMLERNWRRVRVLMHGRASWLWQPGWQMAHLLGDVRGQLGRKRVFLQAPCEARRGTVRRACLNYRLQPSFAQGPIDESGRNPLPYCIEYTPDAEEHLRALTARQQRTVLDTV